MPGMPGSQPGYPQGEMECQEASRFLSREMPECHHGEILPEKIQIIISEKRKEIRLRPDFLEI